MKLLLLRGLPLAIVASCVTPVPELPPRPGPVAPEVLSRVELAPPAPARPVIGVAGRADGRAPGQLGEVLDSVEQHFPLVLAAQQEVVLAEARQLSARGGFDTRLSGGGATRATGYYENEQLDVELSQPTRLWGATFSGGYRLGAGEFPVYDGYDETNEGGEVRLGLKLPLLQGREIDRRRVAEWRARIERERAGPLILEKRLEVQKKAADAYWRWVAWCRSRDIARVLLELAEARQAQVRRAVEEGQQAPIAVTDNERLIVDRRSKLVRAQRNLERSAIELSLYWRDAEGWPVVPSFEVAQVGFPAALDPAEVLFSGDVELALARRPELQVLQLEVESLRLERDLAENQRLPELALGIKASQDLGAPVKDPDDKGELELRALLTLEVPLQRRAATGKQREAEAKLVKLERELQYRRELVTTGVLDAASALRRSWERLAEARRNVALSAQLAEAERAQFREGASDLFRVNVREQQAAVAAAGEVEVLEEHFRAIARYRVVLGLAHEAQP